MMSLTINCLDSSQTLVLLLGTTNIRHVVSVNWAFLLKIVWFSTVSYYLVIKKTLIDPETLRKSLFPFTLYPETHRKINTFPLYVSY